MSDIPTEWRIIPGTEQGYAATPQGEIYRLPRTVWLTRQGKRVKRKYGMKKLKQSTNDTGHKYVGITIDGKTTVQRVHRLVCIAFHGPPPSLTHTLVRHVNGIPDDNRPENLAWGTYKENGRDMSWHLLCDRKGVSRTEFPGEDVLRSDPSFGSKSVSVRIPTRLAVKLEKLAESQRMTRSAYLSDLIAKTVSKHELTRNTPKP